MTRPSRSDDGARLLLCTSCDPARDGAALRASIAGALERAGLGGRVEIAGQACMGACARPVSLGLQGPGRASYVFAGVDPLADADDIAATCRLYLDSPLGWIDDARPCGRLRDCLRARLPAMT